MVSVKVVLVGGSSSSGKTKFKHELMNAVKNVAVIPISLDCGYRTPSEEDFRDISKYDFDHPDAFDWPLLVQTTRTIIQQVKKANVGDTIEYELPHYNFTNHRRDAMKKFSITTTASMVIILEGIFALHNHDLLDLADVKIFIEADEKTRIFRRIIRDILFRNRDILNITLQYLQFVDTAYDKRVSPTKANASLMVNNHITAHEIKTVMDTLKDMGCQSFSADEMKRTVLGKEETFVDGCGTQFMQAVSLIAQFLSAPM